MSDYGPSMKEMIVVGIFFALLVLLVAIAARHDGYEEGYLDGRWDTQDELSDSYEQLSRGYEHLRKSREFWGDSKEQAAE